MGFSWISRIPVLGAVAKFCVSGQRPSVGPKNWRINCTGTGILRAIWEGMKSAQSLVHTVWRMAKAITLSLLARLCQGVPDQSTLFQLYRYWRILLSISVWFWNITSEHGMEITIITEAHCFHKSRMGAALTLSYRTWFQELCLNIEQNSTYRCWKSYWTRFREWGCNSNETHLVPFCTTVSLIIPSW